MYLFCIPYFALACLFVEISSSKVLELSDKFPSIKQDGGYWLVKFYAPWCGYCKRLEPVWSHVAQALYKTNIRVGRIDCTRFPNIAAEFKISGFPTIKFFKANEDHTFLGDGNKEDIVNFAIRMAGPPVPEITRVESITNIKNVNQLFFMYVGSQNDPLWDAFFDVASKLQPHGFFYSVSEDIATKHLDIDEFPAVLVYKDSMHYFFSADVNNGESNSDQLNASMYKWINEERFETFPKITKGNVNEIIQTNKYIVLVVIEENELHQISSPMLEFKNMIETLVRKKRDKYHKHFQFGWVGNPEIANSIAMQVLPLPNILVLNSTTYHYHIPEEEPVEMTAESIDQFLEKIYNETTPVYGGNSLPVRYYRMYFEMSTALVKMWRGNPALAAVLIGLPLSFLCFILYSICCTDILDADAEDEGLHEKGD